MGGEKVKKSLSILVVVLFLLTSISTIYANSINKNTIFLNDNQQTVTSIETDKEISKHFLATDLLNPYEKIKTNPQGSNTVRKQFTEQYNHLKELIPREQPVTIDGEDWDIIVPDDYPSIQGAVNKAGPQNGYRIFVRVGTYKENVLIATDGIVLHGENKDNTVVNGESKGDVISIDCNYLNISGFTIKNSGLDNSGIEICQSSGNIIQDSIIQDNSFGITIHNHSHANNITGNSITGNTYDGIHISNICTGTTVYDNTISDNVECGIAIDNVSRGNIVTWNTVNGNLFGVNCTGFSDGNIFYANSFNNNLNAFDSSENSWDNGNIGNHWSDYTGSDTDGDEIGDTPYYIPGGDNKDNYPLIGQSQQSGLYNLDYDNFKNLYMGNYVLDGQGYSFSLDYIIVPDDYPTIQSAIDNASDGDTIFVRAGIYYENIVVDKKLKIAGNGVDLTIIDGSGLDDHVVNIDSDYVEVSDFTIRNCSLGFSGLRIYGNNSDIHDNTMIDCGGGIELWSINNTKIINNTCKNNAWGIYVHISDNCLIENNVLTHNIYGIELGISSVNISCCDIENNSLQGILCLWSSDSVFNNNSIYSNGDIGIQMFSSKNTIIQQNDFNSCNLGISLYRSCRNILKNNCFLYFTHNGISIRFNSDHNQIGENEIIDTEGKFIKFDTLGYWISGIYIDFSNNNTVSNNIIQNMYGGKLTEGITIMHSCDNTISGNTIKDTKAIFSATGLYLWDSCNNIISENNIKDTIGIQMGSGLTFFNSCDNIVSENTIEDTYGIQMADGLYLERSCNNMISENTITNAMGRGADGLILIGSCDNNTIAGNTITNIRGVMVFGLILIGSCDNNTVSENNITNTNGLMMSVGLDLSSSCDNNTISGNTITNTNGLVRPVGFYLFDCDDNAIFHNNFIDNKKNADDYGNNIWYNETLQEGNYWDDYTGIDNDEDGIGDTPYDIPGGDNKDNYPLMEPWGS